MIRSRVIAGSLVATLIVFGPASAQGGADAAARVQAALDAWLAERAPVEGVTGIAAYVSLGDPGPAIEAFAGKVGRGPDDPAVDQDTLLHMGSTSKSFAAAVILKFEADGKLSLDDTVGEWLPEYPAWADVSIRRLLNMTSGIPIYSETEFISKVWVDEPARDLTAEELVEAVYPTGTNDLPATTGYHYSNTNYILAGMIAANAAGKPYRDLVHELIIEPFGIYSTFYESGTYPAAVVERLARGYFESTACADYQPGCEVSWNQPLVGRDIHADSVSWAEAAGGAISNARDVDRWMRAVFSGRVVPPEQQDECMQMVSLATGEPIDEVTPEDPRGFALGLARADFGPGGVHWFYQGVTLGFRTVYLWYEEDDILITVQTNSQPDDGADKLSEAVIALYEAVTAPVAH
jgi:D-alanyl-D-alanine carboxypeptidase